jgi:hypothetical protein
VWFWLRIKSDQLKNNKGIKGGTFFFEIDCFLKKRYLLKKKSKTNKIKMDLKFLNFENRDENNQKSLHYKRNGSSVDITGLFWQYMLFQTSSL